MQCALLPGIQRCHGTKEINEKINRSQGIQGSHAIKEKSRGDDGVGPESVDGLAVSFLDDSMLNLTMLKSVFSFDCPVAVNTNAVCCLAVRMSL